MLYVWFKASFTGSFSSDFDMSSILAALAGGYSLTDLLASPQGLATITLLVVGIASAGALSFPWLANDAKNLTLALIYTGAKKAKITDLAKKTHEAIQHKMEIAKSVIATVGNMYTLLKHKREEDQKIQKRLARLKVRRQSDLDSLQK